MPDIGISANSVLLFSSNMSGLMLNVILAALSVSMSAPRLSVALLLKMHSPRS